MVFFNWATMQMAAKIVYYGPGLCGKTSNLSYIYAKTSPTSRGEMVSLETESDRTLFFDLLPIEVGTIGGFKTRLQLYTVPGQVFYNTTRKLVLKGVDGLVFVADSQRPMREANVESFRSLAENIEELGLELADLPLVMQYNKRDLQNILSEDELNTDLNPDGEYAYHVASAINGEGVFETLKEITKITLRKLRRRMASPQTEITSRTPAAPPKPTPKPSAPASGGRSISAASLARAAEEGVGHGLYDEPEKPSAPQVDAPSYEPASVAPETDDLFAEAPSHEPPPDTTSATWDETPEETAAAAPSEPGSDQEPVADFEPDDSSGSAQVFDRPEPPPTFPAPEHDASMAMESDDLPDEVIWDSPEFGDDSEPSPASDHDDFESGPQAAGPDDEFEFDDEVDVLEFDEPPLGDSSFSASPEDDQDDDIEVLELDDPDADFDQPSAEDADNPSPEETTAPSLPDVVFHEPFGEAEEPDILVDEAPAEDALEEVAVSDGDDDEVEFDTSAGREIAEVPPPMKRVQISNQTDILAELDGLRRQATEAPPDRRRRTAQTSDLDLDSLLSGKPAGTRDLKRRIEKSLNSNIFNQMRSVQLAFRIQDEDGSTIHTLEPISLDVDDVSALEKLVLQLTVDLENIR